MKAATLTLTLAVFLQACAQFSQRGGKPHDIREERVSDRYSREAVKAYELFDAGIDGHVLMMVRLDGEHFPMLSRKTGRGVYPIPQSVFAKRGVEKWSILCEPRVRKPAVNPSNGDAVAVSHALMRIEIVSADGALLMNDRRLKSAAKERLLSSPW
jgi:hypothetical protein